MSEFSRRNLLQISVAATALGTLAACSPTATPGGGSDLDVPEYLKELVDAAVAEGRMTLYTTMPPSFVDKVAGGFQAKYGIQVNVLRLASTQMLPRFTAEAESGISPCDVFQNSSSEFMGQAADNKWLDSIKDLPDFAEFPSDHRTDYWATITLGPINVAYNTQTVSEGDVPKSWEDLVDSRFTDRVLLVEPRGGAGNWLAWFALLMDRYGEDYLREIAALRPKLVSSNVPGSQQLAAGEGDLIFPTVPWGIMELKESGAPVENVTAISPTSALEHYMGVCSLGQNPNAARLFQHYGMSREGQTDLAGSGYAASVLDGIEGAMPMPEEFVRQDLAAAKVHEEKIAELLGLQ